MQTNITKATQELTAAKANYTKRGVMKAAWGIYRSEQSNTYIRLTFGDCLRRAWKEAKLALESAKTQYAYFTSTSNGRKVANTTPSTVSSLAIYANRHLPEFSGLDHSEALAKLRSLANRKDFIGSVATTCLKTGRISEKQLAILSK